MPSANVSTSNKWISQSNKRALRNPWVLGTLALIATVLIVNITMITLAITTNPGLVSKDYYERGRYNERHYIQRASERKSLGWSAKLELPEDIQRGAAQTYRVAIVDNVGEPLRGAEVILNAFRPADVKADFKLPLEEIGAGIYQTNVEFQLKGLWDLLIDIKRDEKSFELAHRISVQA
ncbi:MAG: FixH family protein [Thiohalomonadaceae bacterium]